MSVVTSVPALALKVVFGRRGAISAEVSLGGGGTKRILLSMVTGCDNATTPRAEPHPRTSRE